jgi:hypothetical protein
MKLKYTSSIILLCFLFSGFTKISGQELGKEIKKDRNFELSFGQSVFSACGWCFHQKNQKVGR